VNRTIQVGITISRGVNSNPLNATDEISRSRELT